MQREGWRSAWWQKKHLEERPKLSTMLCDTLPAWCTHGAKRWGIFMQNSLVVMHDLQLAWLQLQGAWKPPTEELGFCLRNNFCGFYGDFLWSTVIPVCWDPSSSVAQRYPSTSVLRAEETLVVHLQVDACMWTVQMGTKWHWIIEWLGLRGHKDHPVPIPLSWAELPANRQCCPCLINTLDPGYKYFRITGDFKIISKCEYLISFYTEFMLNSLFIITDSRKG